MTGIGKCKPDERHKGGRGNLAALVRDRGFGRVRGLFHGVHADAGLDEGQRFDPVDADILVGMVRILADEFDAAVVLRFLDVFYRDVLFAVDVDREQVHVAPKDIVDAVHLLVQHDVAALEQGIHAVADDVNGSVAFGQVGNVDIVDRTDGILAREERYKTGSAFDVVERYALHGQRAVGAPDERDERFERTVEDLPLAALDPLGIKVQFLNEDVLVSFGKRRPSCFDHGECTLAYTEYAG